jgi:hypothetical protein
MKISVCSFCGGHRISSYKPGKGFNRRYGCLDCNKWITKVTREGETEIEENFAVQGYKKEIEKLNSELKDEREALHEVCYGITKNCELCKKYAFGREQARCETCPTRRFHEIAVEHMRRLEGRR